MWKDLSPAWQCCFELAWEAYAAGSIPIGAVIVNEEGEIVATGRNCVFDESPDFVLSGSQIGHAELSAILKLKDKEHPNTCPYALYSTLEPCPMCFGAMVASRIRNLKYAAADTYAGATELNDSVPYIRIKNLSIKKGKKEMEDFQLCLHAVYEMERWNSKTTVVIDKWNESHKQSITLAKRLFEDGFLSKAIKDGTPIAEVYDYVVGLL